MQGGGGEGIPVLGDSDVERFFFLLFICIKVTGKVHSADIFRITIIVLG